MKDHLLIAGCGYLGEQVAQHASNSGWQVTRLSKSGDNGSLTCDLSKSSDLTDLRSQIPLPSSIVFTASSGRGGLEAYRRVFLEGTHNLFATFPDARLFFTSSTSVYHQTDGSLVTEDSPTEPERETSEILLEAESQVLSNNGTVARLAGIYGPGRNSLLALQRGDARHVHKPGQVFCRVHVDDIVGALLHCLRLPVSQRPSIVNVCDDRPAPSSELLAYAAHLLDCPLPELQWFDAVKDAMSPMALSFWRDNRRVKNHKLTQELGYALRYPSYREGLHACLKVEAHD